jgi:hypothetical protein
VGQPAEGTPEQALQQALEQIKGMVEKFIEALGGKPPEPQAPGAPNGNTGIVPPGAVQGDPAQNSGVVGTPAPNTGVVGTPPVSATPYPI